MIFSVKYYAKKPLNGQFPSSGFFFFSGGRLASHICAVAGKLARIDQGKADDCATH